MTLAELVRTVTEQFSNSELFFGHGTDNPADEAYWLAVRTAGLDFEQADSHWSRQLDEAAVNRALTMADERIRTRRPLAYLLNEAWFAGLPFYVDQRVLVPRSHFGPLIESRLQPWIDLAGVTSILDLCTGSGCIGIALALACPAARVTLADISADALEVADANVSRHRLESRLKLHRGNLFEGLQGCKYDLVVANPPYVHPAKRDRMPAEYSHEPEVGLYSDDGGLEYPLKIVRQAADFLTASGTLMVEFASAAAPFLDHYPDLRFQWQVDGFGDPAILVAGAADLGAVKKQI